MPGTTSRWGRIGVYPTLRQTAARGSSASLARVTTRGIELKSARES